jgi:hypothetical protein
MTQKYTQQLVWNDRKEFCKILATSAKLYIYLTVSVPSKFISERQTNISRMTQFWKNSSVSTLYQQTQIKEGKNDY